MALIKCVYANTLAQALIYTENNANHFCKFSNNLTKKIYSQL